MNKLEVSILHQSYLLTCPPGQEAQLLEAVERVEQQFEQLRAKNRLRSREHVGILLAVNLAYENLVLREQLRTVQQQLSDVQLRPAEPDPLATDTEHQQTLDALQALQSQVAQEQQLAEQLLLRLDAALPSSPEPAAETITDTPFNSESCMQLPARPAENP